MCRTKKFNTICAIRNLLVLNDKGIKNVIYLYFLFLSSLACFSGPVCQIDWAGWIFFPDKGKVRRMFEQPKNHSYINKLNLLLDVEKKEETVTYVRTLEY